MHIRECVDCYTRPWKSVEFSQRHFSSSCLTREPKFDKGGITPSVGQQEFEIDREYYSLDETLTYKVCLHAFNKSLNLFFFFKKFQFINLPE